MMFRFENEAFIALLKAAPPRASIFEPAERSEYIQKQVIDPLKKGEKVNLQTLDFSAFDFRNVTTDDYIKSCKRQVGGWTQGFNRFVKKTPADAAKQRAFF